jgi:hypothetical protein
MKPLTLIFGTILLLSSCKSTRFCRSIDAEEKALHYLVDSVLSSEFKDSMTIYIDASISFTSELSFFFGICPYYPNSDSIWDNTITENTDSLFIFDCRKKVDGYALNSRLKNIPNGLRKTTWTRYNHKEKASIIQLFHYAKNFKDYYYIEFSVYKNNNYLIILDGNLNFIECRTR